MKHNQLVGFDLASSDAYVGPTREVTVVTETGELRVHDGVTPGGRQVPTAAQIGGFSVLRFNAVASLGAPGNLPSSSQNKLTKITGAGTYNLPLLSAVINVGGPVLVKAMVAGVIIGVQSTDQIEVGINVVTSVNMVEGEIVEFYKLSGTLYVVMNRYAG